MIGPNADLHSGIFGGAVANPINVLCKMIGDMIETKDISLFPDFMTTYWKSVQMSGPKWPKLRLIWKLTKNL